MPRCDLDSASSATSCTDLHGAALLDLRLSTAYATGGAVLREAALEIRPGEIVGLAGESGSGKSTLALAILGLLPRGAKLEGRILLRGRDLLPCSEREWRRIRGREIGLVLQSASALNPSLRLETQLREAWEAHSTIPWRDEKKRVFELFERVGLPGREDFTRRFPSQISVGQAQRVLVAMALLHRPSLLVADEPTSALDVITQAELLGLLLELNQDLGTSMLFISHDLLSVSRLCHRVAILHQGSIVESGDTLRVLTNPEHPYTQRLVAALPQLPSRPAVNHRINSKTA